MLSHTALSEEENVAWYEKDLAFGNVTQTEHVNENIDSTSNSILMKPSPIGGKQVEPVAKAMKDSLGETSLRNCSINSSMGSNLVEIVVDP